jgi:uncharacterized repeat protein (TIGR01451 family)
MLMHDPAHTGYTTDTLPSGQLSLKWKVGLGERVEVTMQPIVSEGLVYVGVMNGKLYAINADSGQIEWVYQAGGPISHTAAAADGTVYFGSHDGKIYALDAQTGVRRWAYATAGPVLSSPIVVAQTVLVGSFDGHLYALNTDGGTLKWRYQSGNRVWTSPAADVAHNRVYFGSEDMRAYCVTLDEGEYVWDTPLQGISMRNTYPVLSGDTVIFSTVKPGVESYAPAVGEDWPFPDPRNPVQVWNSFYNSHPERRPLYFLDSATGDDLWNSAQNRYTPLPIPYWGMLVPIVSPDGHAWFPASGGGGDHSLDHDMRLWKIDLSTGAYSQAASQDEYMLRFDETGRHTMAGGKYYYTIDADVGLYNPQTHAKQAIFGNGFGNHRNPLDDPPTVHLWRYSGSLAFGGGVSASSPLVIAGGTGYYVSYTWLYAITSDDLTVPGVVNLGFDPTAGPPSTTSSFADFKAQLQDQVLQIISSGHVQPRPVYWGWSRGNIHTFWREGEVLAALARTMPYLDSSTQQALRGYLHDEASTYLFDEPYSYRERCFVHSIDGIIDPCDSNAYPGEIRTRWFADDLNVIAENLYAMWTYAHYTQDWTLIANNWSKISQLFNRLRTNFDYNLGIVIERESNGSPKRWHTPDFKINTQIAAMFGVSQMAAQHGDGTVQSQSESLLNQLLSTRTQIGRYVQTLYDNGTFHHVGPDYLNWSHDVFPYQGYRNRSTDTRQVLWMDGQTTEIFGFPHTSSGSGIIHDDTPGAIGLYENLIHFYPLYPELGASLAASLLTEIQMYVDSVENLNPWWYQSDSAFAAQGGSENLYNHAHLSAAMFQTKAYVLGETFAELAPQLPWTFADSDFRDIYRLQNLVALLDSYEPDPGTESSKTVDRATANQDDILTYTITLVGSGQAMTLSDPIPEGASYVAGSASVDPDVGDLDDSAGEITWSGTLDRGETIHITFQVRVQASTPTAIENVALLQLVGSATTTYPLQATTIANGYRVFLPLLIRY